MSQNRVTGWGLIGASTIAAEHMIAAIRGQAGHDVVAVASRDPARAAAYAAKHAIHAAYTSVDELLADANVNVVYVSSTNERHHDDVLAAAAAGKHVLCEKPLALTLDDAEDMFRACREAGVVMATNHHLRNAATHRAIRNLVASGCIGRPLFARVFHAVYLPEHLQGWRLHDTSAGGGVILDITVHDVDTLRFVLDAELVEAIALAQRGPLAGADADDGVMAVLRFDNGVLAQLHDAFTIKHAGTGLEIHGELGSIVGRDVMTQNPVGEVLLRDARGDTRIDLVHEDLYRYGVAAFCAALQGTAKPAASAEDGVRSLAGALAVLQASRTGHLVRVSALAI
jgi:1,5-anhydro-D-fructose reductase (1,5-anhydro-D-mannitol-forming)